MRWAEDFASGIPLAGVMCSNESLVEVEWAWCWQDVASLMANKLRSSSC